jgi:phage terminase large subunit-like protein
MGQTSQKRRPSTQCRSATTVGALHAIIITKQASGTAKIDPLMAAFNAIAPMAMNPWSTQPRVTWI